MKNSRSSKLTEVLYHARSSERKLRKPSQKSNFEITANRVTLLPGFLSRGVKSETVHKSTNTIEEPPAYNEAVLNEDLHALFHEDKPPSKRPSTSTHLTASTYFLDVVSKPTPILNRSKSIFKEIKEKYAKKVIEKGVNHDIGTRIYSELRPQFTQRKTDHLKKEILKEVSIIDDILTGKRDPDDMSMNRKRAYNNEEDKENYPLKFSHIPPTKWVFQTPPNRKLNYNYTKIDDNGMKPAILENCADGKIVYEVNNKINVDFSRYSNRQEIDIDKRYMMESSSEDFTFQFHEQEEEKRKFQLRADHFELENHFLSLTCRPKKAPCTVSRISGLKRKRDIFEPETAGCSTDLETINEFDSNFTFINNNLSSLEESFTFKFTSNDGATTGHIFDFDGNKKDTFNFHF